MSYHNRIREKEKEEAERIQKERYDFSVFLNRAFRELGSNSIGNNVNKLSKPNITIDVSRMTVEEMIKLRKIQRDINRKQKETSKKSQIDNDHSKCLERNDNPEKKSDKIDSERNDDHDKVSEDIIVTLIDHVDTINESASQYDENGNNLWGYAQSAVSWLLYQ